MKSSVQRHVTTQRKRPARAKPGGTISCWQDDPISGSNLISRPAPNLASGKLQLEIGIAGSMPVPQPYLPDTPEFRYWEAAEALRRGADLWQTYFTNGKAWQPGNPLRVLLDQGDDLNAYYDRRGLSFFHGWAGGKVVYSGSSPDVLCHELGHAVLDAIRPQLWDAPFAEVAALHECFGDMSAILSALQLPSMRATLMAETNGRISHSSSISRLAEQLGWAIRQSAPDAVDPDCLRNAANSLVYQVPETLPDNAPASMLSSEPHSFSRVFTGAFLEALDNMLHVKTSSPTSQDVLQVSLDMAQMLISATAHAPITPRYYSQVAAHLLEADAVHFKGAYAQAIRSAFVRRGILSLASVSSIVNALAETPPRRSMGMRAAGASQAEPRRIDIAGEQLGMAGYTVSVEVPADDIVLPAHAVGIAGAAAQAPASEVAAQTFAAHLFRRGRVQMPESVGAVARLAPITRRQTHKLTKSTGNTLRLSRIYFDCGCGSDCCH